MLSDRIDRFEWSSDVSALLLGGFAILALVLGAAGIYSVISYTVAKRTREIGLRMALGAARSSVLKMVLVHGLKLAGIGVLAGVSLALVLARFLGSLLYGVSAHDVTTFAVASVALLVVAAVASLLPAWRASRVDPMTALRQE